MQLRSRLHEVHSRKDVLSPLSRGSMTSTKETHLRLVQHFGIAGIKTILRPQCAKRFPKSYNMKRMAQIILEANSGNPVHPRGVLVVCRICRRQKERLHPFVRCDRHILRRCAGRSAISNGRSAPMRPYNLRFPQSGVPMRNDNSWPPPLII